MTEIRAENSPLDRIQKPALVAGVVGLAACLVGYFLAKDHSQLFRSYLVGYVYWWNLTMGAFGLLMVQTMTGGMWGLAIRRSLEGAVNLIPLMLVLFVPMLLVVLVGGLDPHHGVYIWTDPEHAHFEGFKAWWLKPGRWALFTVIYFAVWLLISRTLLARSRRQDDGTSPALERGMKKVAGPGLLFFGITVTFAVIDWVMSIDPHWYSTIYGLLFIAGQACGCMALMILIVGTLSKVNPAMARIANANVFHDLGNLLMALTMLWAYMSFSQLLIMWSGNTVEDASYYWNRGLSAIATTGGPYKSAEHGIQYSRGGWQFVGVGLLLFHFFVPFLLLINRFNKRSVSALMKIAALVLVMRFVDMYWNIVPMFSQARHPEQPKPLSATVHWLDAAAVVGIGGVWLFFFIAGVKRRPLVVRHDPRLLEVAHGHGH